MNLYEYVGNGPTDAIDASGLDFTWGDAKQIGLWFSDNTLGMSSSFSNKLFGSPDVYGAIRQNNAYRLIPGSTWYYDFYKAPRNSYAAYKAQGLPNDDAIGLTFMHCTPIVSSVWGGVECGQVYRPGQERWGSHCRRATTPPGGWILVVTLLFCI